MIAIIDYGAGNLGSVTRALDTLDVNYTVVDSGAKLQSINPSGIILPGVGAFGPALEKLKANGFFSLLKEYIALNMPFLGICLGMQLLMEGSMEAPGVTGLGIFPGLCQRFQYGKVPQIGWNNLSFQMSFPLFKDVPREAYFYFIHSYYISPDVSLKNVSATTTTYYHPFVSALIKGNICGVQFHPEKSGDVGLMVLRNWLKEYVTKQPEIQFNPTYRKTTRIIPCLDIDNGRVVKGVQFKNLRDAGDPVILAQQYNREGADEITFLDIGATYQSRQILLEVVQQVAQQVFVPLCVGGGIRSIEEMRQVLQAGADKVSICSAALRNPELIRQGARLFGSQCIVLSIDAGRVQNHYHAFLNGGRIDSNLDVLTWAKQAEQLGAGEILLNSIDQDGTQMGYNLELTAQIAHSVSIPVIASGGAGTLEHLLSAIQIGKADAVLLASLLHDKQLSLKDIKTYLKQQGETIR